MYNDGSQQKAHELFRLEALLQLLNGDEPDRVVWTADLAYWMAAQGHAGAADPAWQSEEGWLTFHQGLGLLPYYRYEKFWAATPEFSDRIEVAAETRGNASARIWRTPVGELREENVFLPESCSTACVRHPVNTKQDLETLLYIIENRRLRPVNLDDYAERREQWTPYDGLPCVGLPRSPLPSLVYEWAGIQNAVYLLMDHPELTGRICALMEEQEAPILDAMCELAPPLVHFPDNLSSENLTSYYDEFLGPTHRRRIERLHAVGTKCAVHLDGTVRGLLPKLAAAGFDAVEALTPAPVGDVDLAEMRAVADNDRVILWGGVPGAMFAQPYAWADMAKHVEKLLDAWHGQPFIVGVADQVPPDGDIEFCRKISDMLEARRS